MRSVSVLPPIRHSLTDSLTDSLTHSLTPPPPPPPISLSLHPYCSSRQMRQMDRHKQCSGKRVREDSDCSIVPSSSGGTAALNSPASFLTNAVSSQAAITLAGLPIVALSYIASFARGSKLSGACRSTLEAIPELHYKICIKDQAESFSIAADPVAALSSGHMGLQPSGALATGRVVTQITVTGCTDNKDTQVRRARCFVVGIHLVVLRWRQRSCSSPNPRQLTRGGSRP